MASSPLTRRPDRLARLGLLLSLPALALVASGLLQAAVGREVFYPPAALVHPVLLLGGLLAALALNALATLRLTWAACADVAVFRLEVRRRAANLAVLGLALSLLAVLLLHAVGENVAVTLH